MEILERHRCHGCSILIPNVARKSHIEPASEASVLRLHCSDSQAHNLQAGIMPAEEGGEEYFAMAAGTFQELFLEPRVLTSGCQTENREGL